MHCCGEIVLCKEAKCLRLFCLVLSLRIVDGFFGVINLPHAGKVCKNNVISHPTPFHLPAPFPPSKNPTQATHHRFQAKAKTPGKCSQESEDTDSSLNQSLLPPGISEGDHKLLT